MSQAILTKIENHIAYVTLNRPDVHNAFDDSMIAELTTKLRDLYGNISVRAVVLEANGKSFSAGGDLAWMQRMANFSHAENKGDAEKLALLMHTLYHLPKPVIAKVQGSAFGGGVGLIACADIAIAVEDAQFSLSEARLGLIPAVISPYVIAAMGERAARRYFLTAERFSAADACRYQLVHEVAKSEELDAKVKDVLKNLLQCGSLAQKECKELIQRVKNHPIDQKLMMVTAEKIADIRASAEGREGIAAFLEKRKAIWVKDVP